LTTRKTTAEPARPVRRSQKGVPKVKHMVDWDAARLRFVTGGKSVTYVVIGREFGVDDKLVSKRAKREGWKGEREEYVAKLDAEVKDSKLILDAARLKSWNEDTLRHAELLREAAQRQFMYMLANGTWRFIKNCSAKGIQAAASAHVTADKLARLALGAATEHNVNENKMLPVSVDEFV